MLKIKFKVLYEYKNKRNTVILSMILLSEQNNLKLSSRMEAVSFSVLSRMLKYQLSVSKN